MKVFIFDMDGTFIDSMEFWNNLMVHFLESVGIRPEENLSIKLLNMAFLDGVKYVKENYDLLESEEELFSKMTELIGQNYKNTFNIDSETINIFKKIRDRGDKVVLATATQRNLVDIVLDRFSLSQYFDLELVSDEVDFHKDNPQYFLNIAKHFDVPIENCIVVEDALYSIRTADMVGATTFGVLFQTPDIHKEEIKSIVKVYGNQLGDLKEYF